MGWSIGYDENWKRDIGYGVPAYCDHPDCKKVIDRGLSYVCGSYPFGGDHGCGLYFCRDHLEWKEWPDESITQLCDCCYRGREPYNAKPDHPDWIKHKATHPSWAEWRKNQKV